jgi:hypothetical protein
VIRPAVGPLYQDQLAELACTRDFGAEVNESERDPCGSTGPDPRASTSAPNGQRFLANPLATWIAIRSTATIGGLGPGEMGPAPEQALLGDFAIPQRSLLVVGRSSFGCGRRAHRIGSQPRR